MSKLEIIKKETNYLVENAKAQEVTNQETYESSSGFCQCARALQKEIKAFFDPTIENFKKAKKVADDGRKAEIAKMDKYLVPVTTSLKIVQDKIKAYENELARIEEEARVKAEQEAKAVEEKEKQRLLDEAKEAEEWEDDEKAESLRRQAESVEVKPEAVELIKKVANTGVRRVWSWEIEDINLIPLKYFKLDEVKINAEVRANQGDTNIPGIKVERK